MKICLSVNLFLKKFPLNLLVARFFLLLILVFCHSIGFANDVIDMWKNRYPDLFQYYDDQSKTFTDNPGVPWLLTDKKASLQISQLFHNEINNSRSETPACVSTEATTFFENSLALNEELYPQSKVKDLLKYVNSAGNAWGIDNLRSNTKLIVGAALIGPQVAIDLYAGGAAKALKAVGKNRRRVSVGHRFIKKAGQFNFKNLSNSKDLKKIVKSLDKWLLKQDSQTLAMLSQFENIVNSDSYKALKLMLKRLEHIVDYQNDVNALMVFSGAELVELKRYKENLDEEFKKKERLLGSEYQALTDDQKVELRGAQYALIRKMVGTTVQGLTEITVRNEITAAFISVVVEFIQDADDNLLASLAEGGALEALSNTLSYMGPIVGLVPVVGPIAEHALELKKYAKGREEQFFQTVDRLERFQQAKGIDLTSRLDIYRLVVIEDTIRQILGTGQSVVCGGQISREFVTQWDAARVKMHLDNIGAYTEESGVRDSDALVSLTRWCQLASEESQILGGAGFLVSLNTTDPKLIGVCSVWEDYPYSLTMKREGLYELTISPGKYEMDSKLFFTDVPHKVWYEEALRTAVKNGWISYGNPEFNPDDDVTQYHLLQMVLPQMFNDVKVANQAELFRFFSRHQASTGYAGISYENRDKSIKRLEASWVLANLYITRVCNLTPRQKSLVGYDKTQCGSKTYPIESGLDITSGWEWHSDLLRQLGITDGFAKDESHPCKQKIIYSSENLPESERSQCEWAQTLTRSQMVVMLEAYFNLPGVR